MTPGWGAAIERMWRIEYERRIRPSQRRSHGPIPRSLRRRCPHYGRTQHVTMHGLMLRDFCQDCGAQWPM